MEKTGAYIEAGKGGGGGVTSGDRNTAAARGEDGEGLVRIAGEPSAVAAAKRKVCLQGKLTVFSLFCDKVKVVS